MWRRGYSRVARTIRAGLVVLSFVSINVDPTNGRRYLDDRLGGRLAPPGCSLIDPRPNQTNLVLCKWGDLCLVILRWHPVIFVAQLRDSYRVLRRYTHLTTLQEQSGLPQQQELDEHRRAVAELWRRIML